MLRRWLCQADVTVDLVPVDPLLIKSGYATVDGPDMVPVSTFRRNDKTGEREKTYYLPGTSLKGALRGHFERIARTLREGSVCLPYYQPGRNVPVPVESERASTGCGWLGRDEDQKADHYRRSCAACRLFGSLRFGGRFSVSDAYPEESPVLGRRDGVGIDRFTGGTVKGVLFDLQVLEGGRFRCDVRLTNFELWQLAALSFLLLDLGDEIVAFGSGRSRGLGRVRGEVVKEEKGKPVKGFRLTYLRPTGHLEGLYALATAEEREAYGLHRWAPPAPVPLPQTERRGLRHEVDVTATWQDVLAPLAGALEDFLGGHCLSAARRAQ
jgi:CRISPR-associated RAMP protein (TIGR02581 family)